MAWHENPQKQSPYSEWHGMKTHKNGNGMAWKPTKTEPI